MRRPSASAHRLGATVGVLGVIAVALKLASVASAAGVIWIHVCGSWTPATSSGGGTVGIARSLSSPGIGTPVQCPAGQIGNGLDVIANGKTTAGNRSAWQIDAPPGLSIVGAHTVGNQGMVSYGVNQNMGWGGGFYWQGGGAQAYPGEGNYSSPTINSSYFGWQVVCGWSTCNGSTKPGEVAVLELEIAAAETSGPSVAATPGSLGAASGWVRGWWPVSFSADGPSGACQLAASLGGVSVSQPVTEPQSPTAWHQCSAGSFSQSFNTASVGSGASVPLVMWARDAAYDYQAGSYLSSSVTRYVNVDNDPVIGESRRARQTRRARPASSTSPHPRRLAPRESKASVARWTARRRSSTAARRRRCRSAGLGLTACDVRRTTTRSTGRAGTAGRTGRRGR